MGFFLHLPVHSENLMLQTSDFLEFLFLEFRTLDSDYRFWIRITGFHGTYVLDCPACCLSLRAFYFILQMDTMDLRPFTDGYDGFAACYRWIRWICGLLQMDRTDLRPFTDGYVDFCYPQDLRVSRGYPLASSKGKWALGYPHIPGYPASLFI